MSEDSTLYNTELISRLEEGQILDGTVNSLASFGAFVDLGGGVEGLVHLKELSSKPVSHPREVVSVGEQIRVVVLKLDRERNHISLGLKQFTLHP